MRERASERVTTSYAHRSFLCCSFGRPLSVDSIQCVDAERADFSNCSNETFIWMVEFHVNFEHTLTHTRNDGQMLVGYGDLGSCIERPMVFFYFHFNTFFYRCCVALRTNRTRKREPTGNASERAIEANIRWCWWGIKQKPKRISSGSRLIERDLFS